MCNASPHPTLPQGAAGDPGKMGDVGPSGRKGPAGLPGRVGADGFAVSSLA